MALGPTIRLGLHSSSSPGLIHFFAAVLLTRCAPSKQSGPETWHRIFSGNLILILYPFMVSDSLYVILHCYC